LYIKKHFSLLFFSVIFFIIYGLISFVNHYTFRTYALDLGQYNNAIYDYAHFRFNYSESHSAIPSNILGVDHFDLFLVLISPIYWLFGTYTLLVLQSVALIAGGIGIYYLIYKKAGNNRIALLFACLFWSFYGIYTSLAYDYHGNVISAALLPWFVFFFTSRRYLTSLLFFVLIIFCKESMALWMSFVCSGFAWIYRNDKVQRNRMLLFSGTSLIYFVIIIGIVMPLLSGTKEYVHTDYNLFGNNLKEVIINVSTQPIRAFKYLFIEHVPEANPWTKIEFHIFIILSGGFLFFLRPAYLWMMIPIYLTKLYHDRWIVHSVANQYSIEFAPILVLCAYDFVHNKSMVMQKRLSLLLLFLSLAVTIRTFDRTVSFLDKTNILIYKRQHYQPRFDREAATFTFKLIPKNANVSILSNFHPHLAYRDKAYQFPLHSSETEYFLFSNKFDIYPFKKAELDSIKNAFEADKLFELLHTNDSIYLFKKVIQ
jgi:uncharacterized membrane protein